MSGSMQTQAAADALPGYRAGAAEHGPVRRRPVAPGWRGRWERPLTWWAIIGLCSAFWYAVLHLMGVV